MNEPRVIESVTNECQSLGRAHESSSARAEQLIACLEGEIAKRDARIMGLESQYQRDVWGLNNEGDPIGGEPAGVDGLEVVAWLCEWMGDKCGGVYSGLSKTSLEGLRRSQGEDVLIVSDEPLCRLSDAQAIIDGLRGEVADLRSMLATVSKAGLRVRTERDQQAQRIGELEGLLRDSAELIKHGVFEDGICCCGSSVDSHGLGDGHSPVDALAYHAGQVCERIDAALSAGKDGE